MRGHVTVLLAQTLWATDTEEGREAAKSQLLDWYVHALMPRAHAFFLFPFHFQFGGGRKELLITGIFKASRRTRRT